MVAVTLRLSGEDMSTSETELATAFKTQALVALLSWEYSMLMPLGTEPTLTLPSNLPDSVSIVKILSELAAEAMTSLSSFVTLIANGAVSYTHLRAHET